MERKNKQQKDFEHRMMDKGRIPNLACGFIVTVYSFYFSNLPYAELGLVKSIVLFVSILVIAIMTQFLVAPRTNHLLTKDISRKLMELENNEKSFDSGYSFEKSDEKKEFMKRQSIERTRLLSKITVCPFKISLQVAICFVIIMIGVMCMCSFYLKLNSATLTFLGVALVSCCYYAYMIAFTYSESLCSEYAVKLAKQGLDEKSINLQNTYTMKLILRILMYIIIPYIFVTATQFVFIEKIRSEGNMHDSIPNFIMMIILNTFIIIYLSVFLFKKSTASFSHINKELENFFNSHGTEEISLPVDFSSEFSYNLYLVSSILSFLQKNIQQTKVTSLGIQYQTSELTSMSDKIAEQSLEISRIVEKSNDTMTQTVLKQVNDISRNISQVGLAAGVTKHNVDDGVKLLNENIEKIREISDANIETISGIKKSAEIIENVWDCIKKIDSIAEKSKVIAYNAEIEASQSSTEGEKFHIIANEIRRLADTISESTAEIKNKISGIQASSDNLIISSESGTQRIREGSEFFSELEEKFKELKLKTDITAEYATEIQSIVSMQDSAFVQLSSTLSQINSGYQDFALATTTMKDSSQTIKSLAKSLTNYQGEEE